MGKVAYKLKLPTHSLIHPVFHVSLLKKVVRTGESIIDLPAIVTPKNVWDTKPEKVKAVRRVSPDSEVEVLIGWEGLPASEDTWEPATPFSAQ